MVKKIAVMAEHHGGDIVPVTYELLSLAKKILGPENGDICFFILGQDTETPAKTLVRKTGKPVHALCIPGLSHYNGAVTKKALSDLFTRMPVDYICAPHSTSGMDYAPALSVALGGACITGVEDVIQEDKTICFVRSMSGGKISAQLSADARPVVLTLQPGALKPDSDGTGETGKVEQSILNIDSELMIYTGTRPALSEGFGLAKAEVVVSGGRGIRDAQNYQYIELLAGLFPKSATGGSRPICDYKWIPYGKQVGITGTTVSPRLYVACGISGAPQHIEAIKGAQFVVAINTDPDAPVFQIADIGIVEDLVEFIPLFIETFKKKRRKKDERNDLGDPFLA